MDDAFTTEQREMFSAIVNGANVGLVPTKLDGEPTAVIVLIHDNGNGTTDVEPLAVLVTDAMFERLERPDLDGPASAE